MTENSVEKLNMQILSLLTFADFCYETCSLTGPYHRYGIIATIDNPAEHQKKAYRFCTKPCSHIAKSDSQEKVRNRTLILTLIPYDNTTII